MNGKVLAIGLVIFISSVFGYIDGPSMVNQMMNTFTGGNSSNLRGAGIDVYSMMGIRRPEELAKMTQYSSLALMLAGLGAMIFGMMGKKGKPKEVIAAEQGSKAKLEPEMEIERQEITVDSETKTNNRTLEILQERLARGEITSKEYLNLKRILDK